MLKRSVLWAALAASVALAACGGSDSEDTPAPSPGPAPAPQGDRIEPLDTAKQRSAPAKAEPVASSRLPAGAPVPRIELGALPPVSKVQAAPKDGALQIGVGRDVAATADSGDLARQLRWSTLVDGSQVAAVAFAAEGAKAIRLGVLARAVPAGTVLRFYGGSGSPVAEIGAAEIDRLRAVNEAGGLLGDQARMVWAPDTDGAVSTLEVQLPAGASPAQLQLAVPQLSHMTQTVAEAGNHAAKDVGDSGSCNIDVMCSDATNEGRAVAKMVFVRDGKGYLCTGTLLNDTRNSQTPYFLTAAHCISSQSAASSLVTYWFYRTASCNGSQADPALTRRTGGARLLYSNGRFDTTLLQLNDQPPANVVFAGSYFGPDAKPGVGVIGVHHPSGDLQKFSEGGVTGYGNCTSTDEGLTCGEADERNGGLLQVSWRRGITEGGSSGSAIFATTANNTRYVIGSLYGGGSSCRNPGGADYYGRFQRSFADGINRWLVR